MPVSACLEIYELNVGQGDSVLIVNRDLDQVETAIRTAKKQLPADPIDYVPYAVTNKISLLGTVKQALLLDAGDDEYGGDVVAVMTSYGVIDPDAERQDKLIILVSHYHDDHMAGLRHMFKRRQEVPPPKQKGKKKSKKKAKPQTEIVDWTRPYMVYQSKPGKQTNPTTVGFELFTKDVEQAAAAAVNRTHRRFIFPGGLDKNGKTTIISLGTGIGNIPIEAHVLASGQAVYDKAKDQIIAINSVGKNVDQNDRSIVLMLQYGSFRYFLGGDIAGNGMGPGGNFGDNAMDAAGKKYYSVHADVEGTLGPALKAYFPVTTKPAAGQPKFISAGYCTVMKANHHGSSSSVDVHLLSTLRPLLLMMISAGVKTRFHNHPTQQVMERADGGMSAKWELPPPWAKKKVPEYIDNTITQIYLTEIAEKVRGTDFDVDIYGSYIMGDVVVRPVDETVLAVQNATAFGSELTVQVYGSGEQSIMKDPDSVLRATETKNADGSTYPIGPYTHSDKH